MIMSSDADIFGEFNICLIKMLGKLGKEINVWTYERHYQKL